MNTLEEQERAAYMAGDTRTAELLAHQIDADSLTIELERYREALADLVAVINEDSDGEYFICSEAKPEIDAARALLAGDT